MLAALFLQAQEAPAQFLSDLEPQRPARVEDARPVTYRAISGSVDWSYNFRRGGANDHGPGLSLLYGAARGLELGAALRYVTRPGRNTLRGITSGDLELHGLYNLTGETAQWPALAARLGVLLPTGLDSKGTDLEIAALATRSFDAFRLHANLRWLRLGDTLPTERADRLEATVGVDFLPSRTGSTDTILLAAASMRSSPMREGETILELEAGARKRVGMQTLLFGGLGSQVTGVRDRTRIWLRAGFAHIF